MSRKSESKTISIPADAYERLDAAARERDLSHEDVRREAIRLYAKGDPRKRMIAMNIETIERNRRLLAEGSLTPSADRPSARTRAPSTARSGST